MRVLACVICFLSVATAAIADARYEQAIKDYLSDNDAKALPALRELALEGNLDAQVLLSRLRTPPYSPYIEGLTFVERRRLFTKPGKGFGTSWLAHAAADGHALATAYLDANTPPWTLQKAQALLDVGEDAEVARRFLYVADDDPNDIRRLLDDPRTDWDVKPTLVYALLNAGALTTDDRTRNEEISANDPSGFTRHFLVSMMNLEPKAFEPKNPRLNQQFVGFHTTLLDRSGDDIGTLLEGSTARPYLRVKAFCESASPEQVQQCIGDAIALAGGYGQIWRLMSPSSSLIPELEYRQSKRAVADFSRRISNVYDYFKTPEDLRNDLKKASCVVRASL